MSTGRRRLGWLLPTVLVVVLLAGGAGTVVLLREPQLLPGRTATVVPVVRADVVTEVRAPGSVRSGGEADVSFVVSGVVTTIPVAPGATVAPGEVLATLDDAPARARIAAAQTALAADTRDITAARSAVPVDLVAVGRFEAAAARDRAELAEANRQLEGTVLRAPRGGTVTAVAGQVGDRVDAGAPTPDDAPSRRPFVRLADLATLVVRAAVPPRDVPRVLPGQSASAVVDGVGDPVLGEVVGVEPAPGPDGAYGVSVASPLPPPTLRVGQAADVRVVVDRAVGVLVVPPAAVRRVSPDRATVLVPPPDGRGPNRVLTVTTGIADATSVEIRAGLREGDRVLVPRDTGSRP
ncbi:macrolide-specific efflux system membrane fusion protein [Actinomycetospora succinea]|uniref:Macrolide-specific efflux system membrane fusion protein n=1 Tax=Actinomycetospora succinea TaxID=663603 RepID=A0A4R6VS34_9PSEU|nr:efflux RND transporter periplasmic adaptor subunit [Actinomycetospora succinea]TDQ62690.1 macrolide-specific efflux system membrane fusion protein [Actinomycetospora succinea]